ncbi:MAG: hypothetical protein ACXVHB_31555 [Solirubrobacteraceae bacterium]
MSENAVTILTAGAGERRVPRTSKLRVAQTVLDEAERLREGKEVDGADRTGAGRAAGV